jgi:hypothetical protein
MFYQFFVYSFTLLQLHIIYDIRYKRALITYFNWACFSHFAEARDSDKYKKVSRQPFCNYTESRTKFTQNTSNEP